MPASTSNYDHAGFNPEVQIWEDFGVVRGDSGRLLGSVFGPIMAIWVPVRAIWGPTWSKIPLVPVNQRVQEGDRPKRRPKWHV